MHKSSNKGFCLNAYFWPAEENFAKTMKNGSKQREYGLMM